MSSLQYHFDNLTDSLDKLNIKFEVIGICETRIKKDNPPLSNISFQVCKTEYIPGQYKKSGPLLSIYTEVNC